MNKFIRASIVILAMVGIILESASFGYADTTVYDGNGLSIGTKDANGKVTYTDSPSSGSTPSSSDTSTTKGSDDQRAINEFQKNSNLYKDQNGNPGTPKDTSVEDAENKKLERQNASLWAAQDDSTKDTTKNNDASTNKDGTKASTDANTATPGKSSLLGKGFMFNPNDIAPTTKKYTAGTGNLQIFLEGVAKVLLIIVSTGAVLSIVIGGFYMATSGGDTEKANKGKIIITYNIIAIVISLLSYGIIQFVIWLI